MRCRVVVNAAPTQARSSGYTPMARTFWAQAYLAVDEEWALTVEDVVARFCCLATHEATAIG
jgi:hypothetical protein